MNQRDTFKAALKRTDNGQKEFVGTTTARFSSGLDNRVGILSARV